MSAVEDRALEWMRRRRPSATEVRSIRSGGLYVTGDYDDMERDDE